MYVLLDKCLNSINSLLLLSESFVHLMVTHILCCHLKHFSQQLVCQIWAMLHRSVALQKH